MIDTTTWRPTLLAAVLLVAGAAEARQGGPPATPVRVDAVRTEDLQERRRVTGELRAIARSMVATIEPGLVAGQRFTWEGTVEGEPVITVRTNWLMGERDLDPGWSFGDEGERFEIEVTGDPSSKVVFHGWHPESVAAGLERNPGIVATAIHGVSAIPYVCRAEPGIRTYLDLPLVSGRAAPALSAAR